MRSLSSEMQLKALSIAAVMLLVCVLLIGLLLRVRSDMRRIERLDIQLNSAVLELEIAALEMNLSTDRFLLDADPEHLTRAAQDLRHFDHAIETLQMADQPEISRELEQIRTLRVDILDAQERKRGIRSEVDRRLKAIETHAVRLDRLLNAAMIDWGARATADQVSAAAHLETAIERYMRQLRLQLSNFSVASVAQMSQAEGELKQILSPSMTVVFAGEPALGDEFSHLTNAALAEGNWVRQLLAQNREARRLQLSMESQLDKTLGEKLQPLIKAHVSRSLQSANDRVQIALFAFIVATACFLALGYYRALFLRRRVIQPINQLRETLVAVAGGDFGARVPPQHDDEIGVLSVQLNATILALSEQTIATHRLTMLLDEIADYVIAFDDDSRIQFVSEQLLKRLGYNKESMLGQSVKRIVALPDNNASGDQALREVIRTVYAHDGTPVPVHLLLTQAGAGAEGRTIMVGRDCTEEIEAAAWLAKLQCKIGEAQALLDTESAQRQRLELDLLDASEREQVRIGRDLHDDVGQQLAGASFLSSALHQRLEGLGQAEAEDAKLIAQLLGQSMESLRAISRDLSPSEAGAGDSEKSLGALCSRIAQVHGIECQLEFASTNKMESGLSTIAARHLFRIAQEAISNGIRHGRASVLKVVVRLRVQEGVLSIVDNGSGFGTVMAGAGIGVHNMRIRASALNGRIRWCSNAGGTRVTLRFPLKDINAIE